MNEIVYILAILISKDVLSLDEAKKIKKEITKGVISSDLAQMVTKVKSALDEEVTDVKKIDAKDFLA